MTPTIELCHNTVKLFRYYYIELGMDFEKAKAHADSYWENAIKDRVDNVLKEVSK